MAQDKKEGLERMAGNLRYFVRIYRVELMKLCTNGGKTINTFNEKKGNI